MTFLRHFTPPTPVAPRPRAVVLVVTRGDAVLAVGEAGRWALPRVVVDLATGLGDPDTIVPHPHEDPATVAKIDEGRGA